jgi:two-component system invasion response regulator UvrY
MIYDTKIRLILADDHAIVRSGLRRLLEQTEEVTVVAEAGSGERVCQLYDEFLPDVAVIDMSMPGLGGLAAITRIKAKHASARLIGFSMYDTPTIAAQVIKAGAMGYVSKSGPGDEILSTIRMVFNGKSYICASIAQRLAIEALQENVNPFNDLSSKEFEIFRLFANGMSATEIADILNLSQKTISNNITMIKQKLGVNTSIEVLRLAIKYGVSEIKPGHLSL